MARSPSKGRLKLAFATLLVLLAVLFLWHRKNYPGTGGGFWHRALLSVGTPLQGAAGWTLRLPETSMKTFRLWLNLKSENERLEREGKAQQIDLLRQKGLESELAALKDSLQKRPSSARGGVFSRLVAQDASTWNRSFVIDTGTSQGLREDDPVISVQGVVGRVWSVSDNSARVLSILDPASSVAGIDVRSRVKGLARGTGRSRMVFEYVYAGSDIEPGDLIVTSGTGGVFPRNIPLGTVVKKSLSEDGLVMLIELSPAVDFGSMENVFVLERETP